MDGVGVGGGYTDIKKHRIPVCHRSGPGYCRLYSRRMVLCGMKEKKKQCLRR